MTAWKHPALGPIELIPRRLCPKKVWQHFYDVAERWDRLCGEDVAPLRTETERVVGVQREDQEALPWLEGARWRDARDLLLSHHDAQYAPAYRSEMASPETVWSPGMDARHRHHALTPRSVFLVVQLGRPSWVVTAFRPHPALRGVEWDEADLRRHGEWYFWKRTGMNVEELTRRVAENLERASSRAPGSVRELWWLASAVGYGRQLHDDDRVRDPLAAAERALSEVPGDLSAQLQDALDWEGCLARIADALKQARPEDLEAALESSEELLAVAGTLGADAKGREFCEEAEQLIAWLPADWSHLVEHARTRGSVFEDSESLVLRLWEAVEDAAVAALGREAEPATRPAARLVDALIPREPRWLRWRERIAAIAARVAGGVTEWVEASLDAVKVEQPAPAMGASPSQPEPWEVRGRPAPGAPHHRVFVVDDDHPDGCEVTGRFTESDGFLWQIDQEHDRALVIVVASSTPLTGDTLADVINEAARRADTAVRARVLQPIQDTKASR